LGAVTGASTLTSVAVLPVDPVVAEPTAGTAGTGIAVGTVGTVVTELPSGVDTGASTLTSVPGVSVPTELPLGAATGASTLTSVAVRAVDPVVAEPTAGVAGAAGTVVAELPSGADTGASTLMSDPGVPVVAVPELPPDADTGASMLISEPLGELATVGGVVGVVEVVPAGGVAPVVPDPVLTFPLVPAFPVVPELPDLVLTLPLAPAPPLAPVLVEGPVVGEGPEIRAHPTTAWPWLLTGAGFDATGPAEAIKKPNRPAPRAPSAVTDARLKRLCMRFPFDL
jgi:hypothetical protein